MDDPLVAPFPWFGGKRLAASIIWERLGAPANYVDPFAGSLALPLARPSPPKIETVNDIDGLLVNFWRAVRADPEAVAQSLDYPVSEADLHPRHVHLVSRRAEISERLQGDPEFHDVKLAGWWAWGQCAWIGTGWCSGEGPWTIVDGVLVRRDPGRGINRQLPHLGNPGQELSSQGQSVLAWLRSLQERTRRMRITCGDWRRVVTPVVTYRHGTTAIVFDPPYDKGRVEYSAPGSGRVGQDVAEWCRKNGGDQRLRIALCGHRSDYELPGWDAVSWKGGGGYGNQGCDDNRHRECIWFSPGCLQDTPGPLFSRAALG